MFMFIKRTFGVIYWLYTEDCADTLTENNHQTLLSPITRLFTMNNGKADACLPKNLNGAPQVENEEHNWLVMHFSQTTKNYEEDKIPSNHLVKEQNPQTFVFTLEM